MSATKQCVSVPLLLIIALSSGCGWDRVYRARSPNGKANVVVRYDVEGRIQVLLEERGQISLYDRRIDALPGFLHTYWSPDSRMVAVFKCGNPRLEIAYDLQGQRHIPFQSVSRNVRESIEKEYGLQRSPEFRTQLAKNRKNPMDPIEEELIWACIDLEESFKHRHPGTDQAR